MSKENANPEFAKLAVLKFLSAKAQKDGEHLGQIKSTINHKKILPYEFELEEAGRNWTANPYQCPSAYIEEAVGILLDHQAIECCGSNPKTPLRLTDKGSAILAKLESGMSFDEAVAQPDIAGMVIHIEHPNPEFRASLGKKRPSLNERSNKDVESVKQGLLRVLACESEKGNATGEAHKPTVRRQMYDPAVLPSDMRFRDEDIVAICLKHYPKEPSDRDFMRFSDYKARGGKKNFREYLFNPSKTTKEVLTSAWQQLEEEGLIKPGKDDKHVRLTEKGWDAVDELPALTKESYDFRKGHPELRADKDKLVQLGAAIVADQKLRTNPEIMALLQKLGIEPDQSRVQK